jgi:EmrB/QacA subfamily drug resistance transporter
MPIDPDPSRPVNPAIKSYRGKPALDGDGWDDWVPLPKRQVMITMGGVMIAIFLASLDQTIVATAIPRIVTDLGGFDRFAWVTTSYLVASTAVIPIVGKLSDMYGRKVFFIGGILVFVLGSVLAGVAQDMNQLIAFRAIQGVGGGVVFSSAFISIGDLFQPAERGKYMGFIAGIFALSSVVGPVVGGFLTDALSWRWVFYINVPLGLPIAIAFIKFFPNPRAKTYTRGIDYPGIVLLLLTIVPAMLGLSWGGSQYEWSSPQVVGVLALAAASAVAFVIVEMRAAEPIMPLHIYREPIIAVALLASLLLGVSMFAGSVFMPLYFQGALGESATNSGSFLTPMMLGTVVGATLVGQLMSRTGGHYRVLGMASVALMAGGLYMMTRIDIDTARGVVIGSMVLMGFGMGGTFPAYNIAIQNAVAYRNLGVATSAAQFVRSIGAAVGLAVMGSLLTTRFASGVESAVSEEVLAKVPTGILDDLKSNPDALVNEEQIAELTSRLSEVGPETASVTQPLLAGMREALASSIGEVFLVALIVAVVALVITAFLKEIPLKSGAGRKAAQPESDSKKEATQAAEPDNTQGGSDNLV